MERALGEAALLVIALVEEGTVAAFGVAAGEGEVAKAVQPLGAALVELVEVADLDLAAEHVRLQQRLQKQGVTMSTALAA